MYLLGLPLLFSGSPLDCVQGGLNILFKFLRLTPDKPAALQPAAAGFKRCIRSGVARCIRQGTCCTNADCPLANDMCPGPGGRCRCAAGAPLAAA